MSSEYDLHLDERDHHVEIKRLDEGGLLIVKVGTESFTLKVQSEEDGTWVVNDTYTDHTVKILNRSGSSISLEINGEPREVDWSRIRKQVESKTSTTTTASGGAKVAGGIYPPMPGKITEVLVKVGDSVSGGQTVCILEAMKMFNELKSSSAGVIKEVNVSVGSNVTPDDLLVLIE